MSLARIGLIAVVAPKALASAPLAGTGGLAAVAANVGLVASVASPVIGMWGVLTALGIANAEAHRIVRKRGMSAGISAGFAAALNNQPVEFLRSVEMRRSSGGVVSNYHRDDYPIAFNTGLVIGYKMGADLNRETRKSCLDATYEKMKELGRYHFLEERGGNLRSRILWEGGVMNGWMIRFGQ